MNRAHLFEILRYLVAGAINTLFGYGLYAALLWLGLERYSAQAIGYVIGTAFNYVTYSRGVFRDAAPAKLRFAMSYAVNYLISLGGLIVVSRFVANAYLAGAVTTMAVVVVNYLVLKKLVFKA